MNEDELVAQLDGLLDEMEDELKVVGMLNHILQNVLVVDELPGEEVS